MRTRRGGALAATAWRPLIGSHVERRGKGRFLRVSIHYERKELVRSRLDYDSD